MTSSERQKLILAKLQAAGNLQVVDLAENFQVSKMTIHRDLVLLEEKGFLKRIHGGAVQSADSRQNAGDVTSFPESRQGECLICTRPSTQHLLYTLTGKKGEQRQACCAHCGISAHILFGDNIMMALTADYLTGKLHAAQNSFFLLGSVAAPCCHPSVLTFEDEQMARRFQTGFGGKVGRLNEAIMFLRETMMLNPEQDGCPHCAEVLRQNQ
ncbi:DeoR family transcriptional regulator [Geopsychrobacter electrodiphilus]|uniref:DeoR family transcriptional regulator n=1 Tax=Geopsychrobacter electrodiphilus TaxID=225196 RepID=UPI0003763AB7|nr:DeoR family transcriptional regulator [Geopsychrobacter electrodiphilus]